MTQDRDFKRLVRERMRATGQTYTQARADLRPSASVEAADESSSLACETVPQAPPAAPRDPQWERARADYDKMLGRFLVDGRLKSLPARRRARVSVLLHLVARFSPGITYSEPEVNGILRQVVDDHAFWRRELVIYGYLERSGGRYWLPATVPQHPAQIAQEIPDWERVWLPGHLAGRQD